jgi:hypothetical protein
MKTTKHKKTIQAKENIVVETPQVTAPVSFTHSQLLEALFFFWDGFERSSMNFFLIRDTAKQAIALSDLSGDRLTLGIRRLEWDGGQERVFLAFIEQEHITFEKIDKGFLFHYKGVPVYLYLYSDNTSITSLDVIFYANDTFNIPNPFERFDKEFDCV